MEDALVVHRLQFAFTVTFHYIFPQLTMGLALLILILKSIALRTGDENWNQAARFWARIFGISFALGVVTGIPMEFQFGTNWSQFSRAAGGVIGQTLAMEGVFSFFLESSFLGLFLFGEKRLGPRLHWVSSLMMFLGSWLSGYLIVLTDAWMQHPVGYHLGANGSFELQSYWALLLESVGRVAVRAHDDRRGANRVLRHGGDRSLLHPFEAARKLRQELCPGRCDGWRDCRSLAALPHWRRPGQDDRARSATNL